MRINWSSTNMNIIDLYNQMKNEELLTRPYYQRRLVWTNADKEKFIDTILQGLPFPEVYLCQGELDTENLKTVYYVVDGQQRLTTIKNYIEGNLIIKEIPAYKDLNKDQQTEFVNYPVVVRQLGKIPEEKIKMIFDRLNKTDYTLNVTELIYAQYQGEYISLARKLAEEFSLFFENIIGEKSINRMVDISFILQLMSTLENKIYFSGDREVKKFVELYNELYENKYNMGEIISKSLNLFNALSLPLDSLFYKKAACFSLLTELCKINSNIDKETLRDRLNIFEKNLLDNKEKDIETNEFAKFYNYLYQGTASKSARDYRGKLIEKYILM